MLEPTHDRVTNNLDTVPSDEIKGADLAETTLDSVLRYLPKIVASDDTVWTRPVPWGNDCPVAYTVYDSDSDLGVRIAERFLGEGRTAVVPQLAALASIVSPLLRIREWADAGIDSLRVVLNAKTWEQPSHVLWQIVRTVDWMPEIAFTTTDSRTVPGIQFADVAANARRRRIREGRCVAASNTVDSLRL